MRYRLIDGFTLIELLITLTIASIAIAIAVPQMQAMTANSLAKRTSGIIEMDIEFARSQAITRGESVRIIPEEGGFENGWEITAQTTQDIVRVRDPLDDRITVTTDKISLGYIGFTPTGQMEETGSITVRTSGCSGEHDTRFNLLTSGQVAATELTCE